MKTHMSHAQRRTYNAIVAQPTPHNLQWRDVRSMLDAIADVKEQPNGSLKIARRGQTLVLHPGTHKDIDVPAEVHKLRAFIERSDQRLEPAAPGALNLLVVIDHREARIYRTELHGAVPKRIVPHDPDQTGRHLHAVQGDSQGQRLPESRPYYDEIAESLHGADAVLLFGGGTGASSAMEQLRAELTARYADLASRIVGAVTVDDHHLSEDQLLAQARQFYKGLPPAPASPDASREGATS